MNFELYLRQLLSERKERFTCLIGSGFNARSISEHNILASWKLLLGQVFGEATEVEDPDQAVERHLSKGGFGGSDRLRALEREICNHVAWETERQLQASTGRFPEFLIDPDWVSDILTLNVDEWVERYAGSLLGFRVTGWRLPAGFEGRQGFDKSSLRYRELRFPGGAAIRVWHLMGCVARPAGLLQRMDRRRSRAGLLEALRRHHAQDASQQAVSPTWYSALQQPVLVLGTTRPELGGSLLNALAEREGPPDGPGRPRPVFQLQAPAEELLPGGVLPLFDTGGDAAAQWDKLGEVVRRSKARWGPDSRR